MVFLKLSLVILLSKLLDVNSEELFGDHEHSRQLLDHLTESEQLFLFGANPHDAKFEIAHLNHQKRRKRSLSYDDQDLVGLKKHLHVKQTPRSLLDPQFLLLRRRTNATEAVEHSDDERCYYRSEHAALFACGDIRGVIKSNDSFYYIHPLPERFHIDNTKPHVIVKRNPNPIDERTCIQKDERDNTHEPVTAKHWSKHRRKRHAEISRPNLDEFKLNIAHRNNTINSFIEKLRVTNVRQKRGILPAVFVETAVFVDRDLYKHMTLNFPKDTERELVRFVLAMINAVQLIYHDSSLGRPVNFILKRLEILHEDPANLKRPHDIDRFLSNFCTWQRLENPPGDNDPLHWDHALILTGLDLYVVNKNGKVSSQVVGLAPVAGMCTVTSSCTVNEGRHFESVYVVAHEIGHNLGMRHDGPLADNGCDPSAYIMSPTLGSGKITWSQCSKSYLQKFLDTVQSRCLLDHGNSAGQLDHSAEGILPGERFDADQQCMLKYGRGSRHSAGQSLEDICRDLHCQRERYTWTSHPALEGTKCGEDMYCRGGECVERAGTGISATSRGGRGSWARWGVWSECASACLLDDTLAPAAAGVALATRRCTRARNSNGNYCTGHDKKYQSCHAQQCNNVPGMTVREFADEICSRARDVDPDLIGTGLQRIDSDDVSSACAVWCDTRGGGYKSRGWTLPDGTACSRTSPMFCISGVCQKFTCSSNPDAEFSLKPADCEWEALQLQTATPHATSTKSSWRRAVGSQWRPTSGCHYHCISPGVGVRLVRSSSKSLTSIQLCHPDSSRHDLGCTQRKSPYQYATMVCSKYKERVRRLSGLGMQISPVLEDPDRPCRIACQDERVPHRFYLVNGQEGWFPLGTSCGKKNASYCVSGKCLEFGPDNTPLSESVFTLPLLGRYSSSRSSRHRRSLRNASLRYFTMPSDLRSNNNQSNTTGRSNITGLRSNITSQQSNMTGQQSNMTGQQSNMTGQQSNMTGQQSNMTGQQSNMTGQQSNMTGQQSNMTGQQSNMTGQQSNMTGQQSNMTGQQSNMTGQQSNMTGQQSNPSILRSNTNLKIDTTKQRSSPIIQQNNTTTPRSDSVSLRKHANMRKTEQSNSNGLHRNTTSLSNSESTKSNASIRRTVNDVTSQRSERSLRRDSMPVKATLHPHTLNEIIAELNLTHNVNDHIHFDTIPENIEVDFNNPIHIAPEDTFMKKQPRPTWD